MTRLDQASFLDWGRRAGVLVIPTQVNEDLAVKIAGDIYTRMDFALEDLKELRWREKKDGSRADGTV